MKNLLVTIAVGAALFLTNPDRDDFRLFIENRLVSEMQTEQDEDEAPDALTRFGAGLGGMLAEHVVKHSDYLLFSIFEIDINGDTEQGGEWKFVGVIGQFFQIAEPDAVKNNSG